MKTCLAMLLPQMTFQLAVPAEEISHDSTMTIGMSKGLPCIVIPVEESKDAESSTSATQSETESIYSSGYSDVADTPCEAEGGEQPSQPRKPKVPRRSGRARQREKKRSRVSTPSPDGFGY